jgi:Arc/MetJ-type ribon-helix-helix transcriptional regulator
MTVTVRLDEQTEAKLRRLLEQKGGSLSAFVRTAIAEKLEREAKKPTPYELGKHLFGRDLGGPSDLAENPKKYFKEKMRAKHRR